MICPACNARVTLQATTCHVCSFDIATRDPEPMKARARQDLKVALGILAVSPCAFFLPLPVVGLRTGAGIGAFLLGITRLFNAYRRHATARRLQREAPARAVADHPPS